MLIKRGDAEKIICLIDVDDEIDHVKVAKDLKNTKESMKNSDRDENKTDLPS